MKTLSRLFSAALVLALAAAAQAAPHGIFWAQGHQPQPFDGQAFAASNLAYYGGPVIEHAKVYAVFWGNGVPSQTQTGIGPFFANVLDSTHMDWLKEYNTNVRAVDGRAGTNQTIGRGAFAGSITIQPFNTSSDLKDEDIQRELEKQIQAGKLPPATDNNLYMIYFPAGISISIGDQASCSTFCAYHEGFKSSGLGANVFYGVMPICGFGCGFGGNAFDSMTIVSSHEMTEAITDPFPTPGNNPAFPQAWNTSDGQEIGDLCAQGSSTVTGHGIVSKVQWEYDNSISACNKGPWTQFGLASVRPQALPHETIAHPLNWVTDFHPSRGFFDGR